MAVNSSDIAQALITVWDESNTDWEFKKNWAEANRNEFPALHDQEAAPGQPFPYCVFEQGPGETTVRMSGHTSTERHEVRDVPFVFRVHARVIEGVGKTAKLIASDLVEHIIIRFGGHPNAEPKDVILDNGSHLLTQYQNDYGVRMGDEEYQWVINYIIRVDVPVAV